MKISKLQMTDASSWKGLTTENHLGALWQQSPQKVSDLITKIQQVNFGNDLEAMLSKYPTKEFESDLDYTWDLESQAIDNIPLVEARIAGTAVTATSQAGLGNTEFELVFAKDWFSEGEKIVGEQNEVYPILIKSVSYDGSNTVYTCELLTGDNTLFIPYGEISGGQLFSAEYSPVERTMSERGRTIRHKSFVSMRNAFSQIRIEKKTPGNLSNRKMGTGIVDNTGKLFPVWQAYESYMLDRSFREDINRLLMFGTSNRTEAGDYIQKGKSGYSIVEGSGLREQCEASNTSFYTSFDIDALANRLLDLSEGKLSLDARSFMARTGERGAYQFHKALENHVQLFTPLQNTTRLYNANTNFAKKGLGYGGQFVEYMGPNNVEFKLSVDSMYDDKNRNKILHPDGGVTESYRYDIYDLGTQGERANIQKVAVKGQNYIIHGYIPGLRDPFSPTGAAPKQLVTAKDAWEEHKFYQGGVMVTDPSKTAHFIYNGN